jgi:hypothetical protein
MSNGKKRKSEVLLQSAEEQVCKSVSQIEDLVLKRGNDDSPELCYFREKLHEILTILEKHRLIWLKKKKSIILAKAEKLRFKMQRYAKLISEAKFEEPLKYPFTFYLLFTPEEILGCVRTTEDETHDWVTKGDRFHVSNNLLFIKENITSVKTDDENILKVIREIEKCDISLGELAKRWGN